MGWRGTTVSKTKVPSKVQQYGNSFGCKLFYLFAINNTICFLPPSKKQSQIINPYIPTYMADFDKNKGGQTSNARRTLAFFPTSREEQK